MSVSMPCAVIDIQKPEGGSLPGEDRMNGTVRIVVVLLTAPALGSFGCDGGGPSGGGDAGNDYRTSLRAGRGRSDLDTYWEPSL